MIKCNFENGDEVNLRHVTIGVIISKSGKILLEKRGTFKGTPILESGKWALVGGFFDRNETLIEGAKREVMEETGYEITDLRLLRINDSPNRPMEDRQNMDIIFIAGVVSEKQNINEEVSELKWFDIDNLPSNEDMAFDHLDSIELYKKYLKENFPLPILG